MEILIEEIARVALDMVFDAIGHELGVSDEELLQVRDYLEAKLQETNHEEMMCAVVSECDAMREELEGIGLSDAQVSIVKLAFKRGVAVGAHIKAQEDK